MKIMKLSLCGVWATALVALHLANAHGRLICRDDDGFTIVSRLEFLEGKYFNESDLKSFFSLEVEKTKNEELYLILSSDKSFIDKVRTLPLYLTDVPYPVQLPVETSRPIAYFYLIGGNAFFQYRNSDGRVQWVVLQGRNLFKDTRVADLSVSFAGQQFGGGAEAASCYRTFRNVAIVIDDIENVRMDLILRIVRYFDSVLERPIYLSVNLYSDFEQAAVDEVIVFPSLEGNLKADSTRRIGKSVAFTRFRSRHRRLGIYQDSAIVESIDFTSDQEFAEFLPNHSRKRE